MFCSERVRRGGRSFIEEASKGQSRLCVRLEGGACHFDLDSYIFRAPRNPNRNPEILRPLEALLQPKPSGIYLRNRNSAVRSTTTPSRTFSSRRRVSLQHGSTDSAMTVMDTSMRMRRRRTMMMSKGACRRLIRIQSLLGRTTMLAGTRLLVMAMVTGTLRTITMMTGVIKRKFKFGV